MKQILILFLLAGLSALLFSCGQNNKANNSSDAGSLPDSTDKKQIADLLDSFNVAAGRADYARYFSYFTEDATFIGTDATELWDKKKFMVWAKPFFDRGRAWNFNTMERHIYFGKVAGFAWFDELLNTQMKICRGSGVVVKQGDEWKVQQYVLSMTIPNSLSDTIVQIKAALEDSMINRLSGK